MRAYSYGLYSLLQLFVISNYLQRELPLDSEYKL